LQDVDTIRAESYGLEQRRRFKQSEAPEVRLESEATRLRDEVTKLPPAAQREGLPKKIREIETTSGMVGGSTRLG
jgi:hypothetical protein